MPIRVLIVDDTESLRELIRQHVENAGMSVVGEAADGLQAVAVARQMQPDAIILDVEMPVMDGILALPGLRDAAPGAQVVVFSSRTDEATELSALERGAAGYFLKGDAKTQDVIDYVRTVCHDGTSDAEQGG